MKYLLTFLAIFSLSATQIKLGNSILDVEIADTEPLRTQGLSNRASLAEGTGMMFIFDPPQVASFWMKDMKFDISIGFFEANHALIQWIDMVRPTKNSSQIPTVKSPKKITYALEVPIGWFRKNQIQPGDKFQWLDKGQLQ